MTPAPSAAVARRERVEQHAQFGGGGEALASPAVVGQRESAGGVEVDQFEVEPPAEDRAQRHENVARGGCAEPLCLQLAEESVERAAADVAEPGPAERWVEARFEGVLVAAER